MKFGPIVLGACVAIALAGTTAQAQVTKSSTDIEPCCNILSVDLTRNVATARDKAGKTFQFTSRDAALFKSLRVGQAVSADFATGKVTVNGVQPCCAIVKTQVDPQEPCCSVTAINTATGVVTAQVLATRKTFSFTVKDAALRSSLKVGQKVFADFMTARVSIKYGEPCCSITQ